MQQQKVEEPMPTSYRRRGRPGVPVVDPEGRIFPTCVEAAAVHGLWTAQVSRLARDGRRGWRRATPDDLAADDGRSQSSG